ncbi:MAG: hypothetical protein JNM43_07325 [Planctomycetaceae bacterium]|nr:hypothetical protein [Planctomycetaceae bacterium]
MTEQTLEPATKIEQSSTAGLSGSEPASATQDSGSEQRVGWSSDEGNDFDYVPISPWAPLALCLGLLSLTGFIGLFGLYVAAFGIFIGLAAFFRVRGAAGAVKGGGMSLIGLVLSVASLILGSAKMAHAYSTEVPDGYMRINFQKEIAEKQFYYVAGKRKLDPEVSKLVGKKLYLKGFMWATQATDGLPRFILLKDNGECCFGGKPKSHDFITVTLSSFPDGQRPQLSYRSSGMSEVVLTDEQKEQLGAEFSNQLTTKSYIGMVAVAGVLKADVKAGEGKSGEDYEFAPVYSMDAELVEDAWTRF